MYKYAIGFLMISAIVIDAVGIVVEASTANVLYTLALVTYLNIFFGMVSDRMRGVKLLATQPVQRQK